MPLPPSFALTPSGISSSEGLNEAFYDPKFGSSHNSFEVLNGHLGSDNLETGAGAKTLIEHRKIQTNCASYARMAGLTGNLTYGDSLFTDSTKNHEDFLDIPGCSVTIPVRMDALVIFTWVIGGAVNTSYNWADGDWGTYSMPTSDLPGSYLGGCFTLKISRLDDGVWRDVEINPTGSRAVPPGSHMVGYALGGTRYNNKRVPPSA